MSILSVDQIQPIGSGTTITLNATEVKTGTEITVGTGASIFSPAGNTLTLGTNNVERLRITNDGTFTVQTGGSERARIDSSGRLLIGLTASQTTDSNAHSKLQIATSAGPNIGLGNNSTDINNNGRLGIINFNSNHGGTYHEVGVIASRADADHASNSKPSRLEFYTTSSGNTQATERLRIDSGGRLLIGTTSSTAHTNAGNLQIGDYSAGGAGITINTTTSGSGNIYFGDSSSSIRRGRIEYDHSNDAFRHYTADSERFRIDSSGRVLIGTTTEGEASADNLTIADSGNSGISIRSGTSSWGSIFFSDATSGTGELSGAIEYKHNDNFLRFRTNALERLRITSAGQVNIGDAISGMNMGFGTQLLSAKSGTYSAGIFGSNGSALTAFIVYADHASYAANLLDWRTVRSNNSAFNFLRCSSNSASDNEFFIGGDGVVYSDGGTTMQSPADYAEMFEWSDGNSSDEDRRGYTVVLDGNKVRIATSSDSTDNIIGVVSGNPAVLADNAWDRWAEKYQKDDYNCYVRNSDGDRILNSSYDDTQTYVPREDRKEWDAIGMVGKLRVRKGQQTGTRWLKMRNVSDSIEEWLVR